MIFDEMCVSIKNGRNVQFGRFVVLCVGCERNIHDVIITSNDEGISD